MTAAHTQPIDLYFWPTPNGFKISILLEELGVPYTPRFINIGRGDQLKPEFLKISPNNRIPAIVDPAGPDGKPVSVFESGAIMMYLGDKFGAFYPKEPRTRIAVHEWLFWQMAHIGPTFGQYNHFHNYASEKIPYAIERFTNEVHRLYRVLNGRLAGREYVADTYSIADIALFGWVRNWANRAIDIAEFPHVEAWHGRISARPAVQRGLALKAPSGEDTVRDEESRKILYGQR